MTVWVALLRGVNVGGHNKVPMAELRAALTADGFDDVATYIASGNVVLRAPACEPERVSGIIADSFGLDIPVVVRSADQLRAAVEANPFPQAVETPKLLYCFFTTDPVDDAALDGFDHGRYAPDRVATGAGEIYAHYPDGMARSKLDNSVLDRVAGAPTTARNWNTVLKLREMAAEADPGAGS
jgi:uncharacterized protein (DUF1697 family)